MKIVLGSMHVQDGYFCLKLELKRRNSARTDSANDFIVLRNLPGDSVPQPAVISASFKTNFFCRCVKNYNILRGIDLDQFSFKQLRSFLQLQSYGWDGHLIFA